MRVLLRTVLSIAAVLAASAAIPVASAADAARPPTVLVVGATGETGLEMMAAAQAVGLRARGLTRNRARADAAHPGLDWFEADVRDPDRLAVALRDVRYVIATIGAPAATGTDSPQFIDYLGVVNAIDAALDADVQHFVLISSAAAGPHREPRLTPRLGFVLLWKTLAENHLKASGLDYTIIGPGGLYGTPARTEGLVLMPRSEYLAANVSRGDVARVAVDALRNGAAVGKSFALINSGAATTETWRDQLAALPLDASDATAIENLAWLAGHWTRAGQGATLEELWLPADAGIMLGVNRSVTANGKRAFEQLQIEERADGVYYLAAPGGGSATEFKLVVSEPRRAVFENAAHDFPQRIEYQRVDDSLTARVSGALDGKAAALSWTWRLQQRLRVPYLAPEQ